MSPKSSILTGMETTDQRPTILIVDDSRDNVQVLASLFQADYAIKVALNGLEAIRIAETLPQPDLILLDVMMPVLDGHETCRRLKQVAATADIPVIFLTAMDQPDDEELGLALGAIDYIVKPIKPAIVKARVKNHLELKKLRDLLRDQSMLDGLTGLSNRRRFNQALTAEWSRAQRTGSSLSLVMVDIDYFKQFNDTYGHLAGDDCLKAVAGALQAAVKRSHDLVARWGGEEFCCLLPETNAAAAGGVAERMRQDVAKLQIEHQSSLTAAFLTISLGIAAIKPDKTAVLTAFLESADMALYQAKKNGKNQVCISV